MGEEKIQTELYSIINLAYESGLVIDGLEIEKINYNLQNIYEVVVDRNGIHSFKISDMGIWDYHTLDDNKVVQKTVQYPFSSKVDVFDFALILEELKIKIRDSKIDRILK